MLTHKCKWTEEGEKMYHTFCDWKSIIIVTQKYKNWKLTIQ